LPDKLAVQTNGMDCTQIWIFMVLKLNILNTLCEINTFLLQMMFVR